MKWAKVVKSQSLFWPRISKARRSDAGQVGTGCPEKTATIVFGHKWWNVPSKVKIYTLLCCHLCPLPADHLGQAQGPPKGGGWQLCRTSHSRFRSWLLVTAVLKLLSFCSGHFTKSKRVFGWSQPNFLRSDRRVQWKQQKCSLLSKTHSRCGNTFKLFAFVTMIFATFRTMFMVSLNRIGTRVLEHEPKAWVSFFIGHPVYERSPFGRTMIFFCRMTPVSWFCHMETKWSVLNRRLLF